MWFALKHWCFLLGHLGFTATQTALPTIVINNIIIINKIPQCSDFRCHLTSCCTAQAFWRLGWDLEDSLPKIPQRGEHGVSRHPASSPPEHRGCSCTSDILFSAWKWPRSAADSPAARAKLHLPLIVGQRIINTFVHRYMWLGEHTVF